MKVIIEQILGKDMAGIVLGNTSYSEVPLGKQISMKHSSQAIRFIVHFGNHTLIQSTGCKGEHFRHRD